MVTIKNPHFSVAQIWNSGQCFRMKPLENDTYEIVVASRHLKIQEQEGKETIFYCTEEEFETFWKGYFDLENDYNVYIDNIDKEDAYLQNAVSYGNGIRILQQDLWEMIISFIISQQNNIRRIRMIIETLCQTYGNECYTEDNQVYYTFPTPEALSVVSEEELRSCNLGYRSKYIVKVANTIASGEVDLDKLKTMPYKEAKNELEVAIREYMNGFELPDKATIYDFLVLSLTSKDLIATFNWDPFLVQAMGRVQKYTKNIPQVAFLH